MNSFKGFLDIRFFILTTLVVLMVSCAQDQSLVQNETDLESQSSVENTNDQKMKSSVKSSLNGSFNFCSKLELSDIEWPQSLPEEERSLYALAMNITGSFEGNYGWGNLTNNFDGQGLSLGLFQQNLGQGSLQPLLIEADRDYDSIFEDHFNFNQRDSLRGMLDAWLASSGRSFLLTSNKLSREPTSMQQFSPLDIEGEFVRKASGISLQAASNLVNQRSVDWALDFLFTDNGKTFGKTWKKSLKGIAEDPRYVSLQAAAGHNLHKRAMRYLKEFKGTELRSYLFFYDITVQNGYIQDSVRVKYYEEIAGKDLTENERMKILFKYRLERVLDRWKDDVSSRKLSILNGTGLVHGYYRNYEKEYCLRNLKHEVL